MYPKIFPSRLTLGIPKQEKIKAPVSNFLKSRGFTLTEDGEIGTLIDRAGNIPNIRVEFIRAADALLLMQEKVLDMAMIGSDVMRENTEGAPPQFVKPTTKMDLGIAGCAFQLAVPEAMANTILKPADLNGLRFATSYPTILGAWLSENNVTPSKILIREGGVESSIRMGIADAIADLVDTGSTLRHHKLKPVFNICRTSAV